MPAPIKVYASLEQHIEWIQEGNYSSHNWFNYGYEKYKHLGAHSNPNKYFKKSWNFFKKKNRKLLENEICSS